MLFVKGRPGLPSSRKRHDGNKSQDSIFVIQQLLPSCMLLSWRYIMYYVVYFIQLDTHITVERKAYTATPREEKGHSLICSFLPVFIFSCIFVLT